MTLEQTPRSWPFGRTRPRMIAAMSRRALSRLPTPALLRPVLLPFLLSVLLAPAPASAQENGERAASRDAAPMVYIDCNRCDFSHIRSEITFVNYVRDPGHAQIHVIITDQSTGAGSRVYTYRFLGRGAFAGVDNTLTYASHQTDTAAQERAGLVRMLKLGLVPYVARTPLASQVDLSFREPAGAPIQEEHDPWRNWTFEVYGGGNFSTESTQSAWNARYGFYANRVTEDWKVRLRPYFNHNVRTIQRGPDEDDIRIDLKRHGMESYVIKSLGPHWGGGIFAEYITATVDNLEHGFTVAPAVEYSFFPYGEAATRQITLSYRAGYEYADYAEETIYEKTEESLFMHSLEAAVRIRQPWGSIFAGLTGSNYLHDVSLHRLALNGNVSFRLGHGVSLNVGGNYQRINDQVALPRRDASLEDILLQRRRLATAYRGSGSIGLSYSFGSIFTNVVNPRL
jgi:hypothetical protein